MHLKHATSKKKMSNLFPYISHFSTQKRQYTLTSTRHNAYICVVTLSNTTKQVKVIREQVTTRKIRAGKLARTSLLHLPFRRGAKQTDKQKLFAVLPWGAGGAGGHCGGCVPWAVPSHYANTGQPRNSPLKQGKYDAPLSPRSSHSSTFSLLSFRLSFSLQWFLAVDAKDNSCDLKMHLTPFRSHEY